MFNAQRILDQLVGSGIAGGMAGGVAGGALVNLLAGKQARKFAGSALKLGGVALIGGLAYKAWQHYQQGRPGTATPAEANDQPAFVPAPGSVESQTLSLLLTRAMIAAAKADGQIDMTENQAILEQINGLGLDAEDRAFLFEEYARPIDTGALVRDAHTPAHAAEVYAASLLILDPPSPPEQIYLDKLAQDLALDAAFVAEIRSSLQASRAAA